MRLGLTRQCWQGHQITSQSLMSQQCPSRAVPVHVSFSEIAVSASKRLVCLPISVTLLFFSCLLQVAVFNLCSQIC